MAEIPRILQFSAVGGVKTLTEIGLFFVFYTLFHLVILSYGCGAILGFTLNRSWTYANAGHGRATGNLALRFAVVNLLALTLSTALNLVFPLLLVKVLSVGATAGFSCIGMKLLVFSGSSRNP